MTSRPNADASIPQKLSDLRTFVLAVASTAAVTLAVSQDLQAHEGATGVVKERMDLMETQKDAMKVIGAMAKGKAPFDAAAATAAAKEIETTAREIPELFPEGTVGDPSEAKPEIWTQWDRFVGDAEALSTAAKDLVEALGDGSSEWKAKFKGVIEACKTCHKTFREKDD